MFIIFVVIRQIKMIARGVLGCGRRRWRQAGRAASRQPGRAERRHWPGAMPPFVVIAPPAANANTGTYHFLGSSVAIVTFRVAYRTAYLTDGGVVTASVCAMRGQWSKHGELR